MIPVAPVLGEPFRMRLTKQAANDKRALVVSLHKAGKSQADICRELNLHKASVWRYLKSSGISFPKPVRAPLKKKKVAGKRIEVRVCKTCGKEKPVSAFGNKYNQSCSLCYKNGAVE